MRLEPQLIQNLLIVAEAYSGATGVSLTTIGKLLAQDGGFFKRAQRNSIRIRTYDEVMGRLSAVWPASLSWPQHVTRPAPIEPEHADALAAEVQKKAEVMARRRENPPRARKSATSNSDQRAA